jgi:hypothetical protein
MRWIAALGVFLLFVGPTFAREGHDPDEGALSSVKPAIAEPMVFDLVRPLGAEKGEVEINSLFIARRGRLQWAPEIEWCFAEGYAIELELPMENTQVESYKLAFQGLLPRPRSVRRRFVHGWQTIIETDDLGGGAEWYVLHLSGLKLSRSWSTFWMHGLHRENDSRRRASAFQANHSVFRRLGKSANLGVESNYKSTGLRGRDVLLVPQLHWRKQRLNVQVGGGFNRFNRTTSGLVSWRLIREF